MRMKRQFCSFVGDCNVQSTFSRTKKGAANIKAYKLAVTIQNPCFVANDATKIKALILFHWCSNCKTRV